MFNIIPEQEIQEKKITCEKLIEKIYDEGISKNFLCFNTDIRNMIFKENGNLSNLGQSLSIMDNLTNNNIHILYMSISLNFSSQKYNFLLFKILIILFILRQQYLINSNEGKSLSNLEIILNRKYDKNSQTLLLKSVERKNKALTKYLAQDFKKDNALKLYLSVNPLHDLFGNNKNNNDSKDEINNEKKAKIPNNMIKEKPENYASNIISLNINIYETNKMQENVLHYALKSKDAFFIDYFIKLDADKNILKNMKDNCDKTAQDYDIAKEFNTNFIHIWEAAKSNDLLLFEKIVKTGYYTIDEQSPIFKNTPLHIASSNLSDRIVLYLIKNNCNLNLKNSRNLSALDCAIYTSNKLFIKKFKLILNQEITEFVELENFNLNYLNKTNMTNNSFINSNSLMILNNIKISNKKIKEIKNNIKKGLELKKINLKDVFYKVDENKNGITYILHS